MISLERNENEITKDKSSENVPNLEVIKVVLVHCNISNNVYQQDLRVVYAVVYAVVYVYLLQISHLVAY